MEVELVMPVLGEEIEEGQLRTWVKSEGDAVTQSEVIAVISTPKLDMDLESPVTGVLKTILVDEEERAAVGQTLAIIQTGRQPMQQLEAAGETIRYLSAGSGAKVIVLVHGFGSDARSWTMNLPGLAATETVHALDLPGHGASPAHDIGGLDRLAGIVAAAIRALTPEPVHLVGHSMGGAIALRVAELTPRHLRALTLIAPAGLGTGRNTAFIPAYLAVEDAASAEHALRMLVKDPALIDRQMIEGVLAARKQPHIHETWQKMRVVGAEVWARPAAARAALAALAVPVQIIWGEQDAVLPPEGLDDLPPNVRLHRIPDAGHVPHMEAMETVNRLILALDAAHG